MGFGVNVVVVPFMVWGVVIFAMAVMASEALHMSTLSDYALVIAERGVVMLYTVVQWFVSVDFLMMVCLTVFELILWVAVVAALVLVFYVEQFTKRFVTAVAVCVMCVVLCRCFLGVLGDNIWFIFLVVGYGDVIIV